MTKIKLSDITIDYNIQLKSRGINNDIVAGYVEAMSNGDNFPPIIIFQENGHNWLADGFHRVSAARFLGINEIEANTRPGTKNDALIYAAEANVINGRPMSREEKKEAGLRLLELLKPKNYSEVARRLRLQRSTVEKWDNVKKGTNVENSTNEPNFTNAPEPKLEPEQTLFFEYPEIMPQKTAYESNNCQLLPLDFESDELDTDQDSIDSIITDPPYPREYIYLYEVLAKKAALLLKPGGSLLAMAGQSYLPEIFKMMTPYLNYQWTLTYLTPGGQSPQIWPRKVNTFWKPVLWFVKGEYTGPWVGDVLKSAVNDNDKRYHDWGQSESGFADLIERFTRPGDLILDPFCGGGTTGYVALNLNRRFIGIDKDPEAILTSRKRIYGN